MARIGIILGDETIEVCHEDKGVLFYDLAYASWDFEKQKVVDYGAKAKSFWNDFNNPYKVTKLFDNGEIHNQEVFKDLFKQVFQPLKDDLENNDFVVGIPGDLTPDNKIFLEKLLKSLKPKTLTLIPNIYLLALGIGCDVSDDYGTIILNFGSTRTSGAIIADNKIVNFKVIGLAEDYLTNELLIYFKENYQIILGADELNQIKYGLASLSTTKQEVQLLVTGKDLLTNKPKEILIDNSSIRKILTGLFANYRTIITSLLEGSPTWIRTGITKNGLMITGKMGKINGIGDYFTDFFEFPTVIIDEKINENDALKEAMIIKLKK